MSTQQHRRSNRERFDAGTRRIAERLIPRTSAPRTIDYTCKRCGLSQLSQPLPTNPDSLRVYGLPAGWELGSALEYAGVLPKAAAESEDFCLCEACTGEVRQGYPLDLRDLGAGRKP